MAKNWPIRSVDDVRRDSSDGLATGPFGSSVSSKFFQPFGIPMIRGSNLSEAVGDRLVERDYVFVSEEKATEFPRAIALRGDIVFTCWGTIGQVGLIDKRSLYDRYLISNKQMKLSPDPSKADSLFLYYLFVSPTLRAMVRSVGIGSSVPGFNLGQLRSLTFPLPPLPEQRAIARVLGALDDKIELNRQTSQTLERVARAIFQAWFVDFEPVKAKAGGARSFPSMPQEAFNALPARLVESELGSVPEGWRVRKLCECIGFTSGFAFKSQDWQESGVPVVKIGSVKPGMIDLSQVSYVSEEIAQQAVRYRLSPGDLLIGMTGYVGEVGLVPPTRSLPLLNQRVGKFLMSKPGTESLGFWYCTTRQTEFRAFVEARAHGTAQANVSGDAIMEFPLTMPSACILDAFNCSCRPMLDCILGNHTESHRLAALRDYLLPKLMSGEVRVADMAGIVGESTTK